VCSGFTFSVALGMCDCQKQCWSLGSIMLMIWTSVDYPGRVSIVTSVDYQDEYRLLEQVLIIRMGTNR